MSKVSKITKAWALINKFNFNTISCSNLPVEKDRFLGKRARKVDPLNIFNTQEEAEEMLKIWEEKNPYQAHDLQVIPVEIIQEIKQRSE